MLGRALACAACALVLLTGCGGDDNVAPGAGGTIVIGVDAADGTAVSDSGGSSQDSTDAGPPGTLGARCTQAADCAAGLTCFAAAGDKAAPPYGLCSIGCTMDSECGAIQVGAGCDRLLHLCYEPCHVGVLAADKCHGRLEMGCQRITSLDTEFEVCAPTCSSDEGCDGKKCFPLYGVCETNPLLGTIASYSDLGGWAAFSPDGGTDQCSVLCGTHLSVPLGALGFCTAPCTFGAVSCGWKGTGSADAACLLSQGKAVRGDRGLCAQLCDCDGDCFNSLAGCKPFTAPAFGHKGYCTDPALAPTIGRCPGGNLCGGRVVSRADASTPDGSGESGAADSANDGVGD